MISCLPVLSFMKACRHLFTLRYFSGSPCPHSKFILCGKKCMYSHNLHVSMVTGYVLSHKAHSVDWYCASRSFCKGDEPKVEPEVQISEEERVEVEPVVQMSKEGRVEVEPEVQIGEEGTVENKLANWRSVGKEADNEAPIIKGQKILTFHEHSKMYHPKKECNLSSVYQTILQQNAKGHFHLDESTTDKVEGLLKSANDTKPKQSLMYNYSRQIQNFFMKNKRLIRAHKQSFQRWERKHKKKDKVPDCITRKKHFEKKLQDYEGFFQQRRWFSTYPTNDLGSPKDDPNRTNSDSVISKDDPDSTNNDPDISTDDADASTNDPDIFEDIIVKDSLAKLTDEEIEDFMDDTQEEEPSAQWKPPIDLTRGKTGVFDIDQLMILLKEQKAQDVCVIKLPEHLQMADYMVIASGKSTRQIVALMATVQHMYKQKKSRRDPFPLFEKDQREWLAVHLGNIILHVMLKETRKYYDLESLWTVGNEFELEDDLEDDQGIFRLSDSDLEWLKEYQGQSAIATDENGKKDDSMPKKGGKVKRK